MLYEYLLWSGILISPLHAGISFGGKYCSTCNGEVYCDSGCCHDHGMTQCCPNITMIVVGSVFGTLLVLMVLAAVILICLRRNRRRLHASNKYINRETQTLLKPPEPETKTKRGQPPVPEKQPVLPPESLLEDIINKKW